MVTTDGEFGLKLMGRFSPRKILSLAVLLTVLGYLSAVGGLYAMQRTLLYNPGKNYQSPAAVGISDAQEVLIATPDGERLMGWYRQANAGKPTVLFFHGKSGTLSRRQSRWKLYAAQGYGILFFDYRGFGKSSGEATEAGLKIDALAAFDWLAAHQPAGEKIVLVAESLGTGLAVYVAAERPVAGLSLMAAYSSIVDVAAHRYWWVPVDMLIHDRFDTLPHAARVRAPLLSQHGDMDQTIPLKFGERLFETVTSAKQFVLRKGRGHNDFGAADFAAERRFIEGLQ